MPDILGKLPWGHNVVLVEKVKDIRERFWYAQEAITNGWSRAVLTHQIESGLYQRQKGALKTTNFSETLPSPYSEMMEQAIKDPYIFDFINLGEDAKERDLEKALLDRIRDFLRNSFLFCLTSNAPVLCFVNKLIEKAKGREMFILYKEIGLADSKEGDWKCPVENSTSKQWKTGCGKRPA